jgi:hypothetical protein
LNYKSTTYGQLSNFHGFEVLTKLSCFIDSNFFNANRRHPYEIDEKEFGQEKNEWSMM